MGVNCPDVRLIIHLGPPSEFEMYVQEIGRGGMDGLPSYAILLSTANLLQNCSDSMINYFNKTTVCRRDILFAQFDNYNKSSANIGCNCCDIYLNKCTCSHCKDNLQVHYTFIQSMFGLQQC
jgi:ATP-dependent DNA helicase RecQ